MSQEKTIAALLSEAKASVPSVAEEEERKKRQEEQQELKRAWADWVRSNGFTKLDLYDGHYLAEKVEEEWYALFISYRGIVGNPFGVKRICAYKGVEVGTGDPVYFEEEMPPIAEEEMTLEYVESLKSKVQAAAEKLAEAIKNHDEN